ALFYWCPCLTISAKAPGEAKCSAVRTGRRPNPDDREDPSMQLETTPTPEVGADAAQPDRRTMLASLARFQAPSVRRSVVQLSTTAAPYAGLVAFMYYAYYHLSPWLSLALAI